MDNGIKEAVKILITAGGKGSRLWPLSTTTAPKPFRSLLHDRTMLQDTFDRATPIVPPENIYVGTHADYAHLVKAQLPLLPASNIIEEPENRDTAPAIGYAAAVIGAKYPGAIMVVLASDQWIAPEHEFHKSVAAAATAASLGSYLVSIGVTPRYPHTGYGYMECGDRFASVDTSYFGKGYVEKPDLATATRMVDADCYLWNTGMFAWKIDVLLRAFAVYQPKCHDVLRSIQQLGKLPPRARVVDLYHGLTKTSIDYAILERIRPGDPFRHVFVRAGFDWDDIGTIASLTAKLRADSDGNRCRGNIVARDCHDCVLIAEPPIEVRASGVSRIALFANDEGDVLITPAAFAQSERSQVLERCFFERTGYPLNVQINASEARIANGNRGNVIVVDSGSMSIQVEENLIRVSKEVEPANGSVDLEHKHEAIVCADYAAMSELAAAELTSRIRGVLAHKSRAVVALSTGRTPELLYELLRSHYRSALDWSRVAIVEMDDYVGIAKESVQSATCYLRERVIDPLGIQEAYQIPNETDITDEALSAFEAQLRGMGALDVVVHGIGRNGHIGFNEPGSSFSSCSRVVTLAESTIRANSGRFPGMEAVPRRGVTLGLGFLSEARVSILLASGPEKHEAIRRTLCGPVSEDVPATVLKRSPSAIYLLDEDAWRAPKAGSACSL